MKTVKFLMITIVLLMITTWSVAGTVKGQDKNAEMADAQSCRMMENRYISALRSELESMGYNNAGITMTKITDENGLREYTVLLHHKKMDGLHTAERDRLTQELASIPFPIKHSGFCFEFLENES